MKAGAQDCEKDEGMYTLENVQHPLLDTDI